MGVLKQPSSPVKLYNQVLEDTVLWLFWSQVGLCWKSNSVRQSWAKRSHPWSIHEEVPLSGMQVYSEEVTVALQFFVD